MDNFIGKQYNPKGGFYFDACWIVHGTPHGQKLNDGDKDLSYFSGYIGPFHGKEYISPWPSIPDEKFIKEKHPNTGSVAYTFLRTGIYEYGSDRPGSNYGAITVFMDDMDEKNQRNLNKN